MPRKKKVSETSVEKVNLGECFICTHSAVKKCPVCGNVYCDIHFMWHLRMYTECKKQYEKIHGKLNLS